MRSTRVTVIQCYLLFIITSNLPSPKFGFGFCRIKNFLIKEIINYYTKIYLKQIIKQKKKKVINKYIINVS